MGCWWGYSSETLPGKKTVIYVYPKDDTSGCMAEACDLRDNYKRFLAQDYLVMGISTDSVSSQVKFVQKFELPFILL